MNKLPLAKRVQVISALMEGVGVNAASRMTEVSKTTILKLVVDLGTACAEYHDKHVRNLKAKCVQCDEVWSFCYAKAKFAMQKQSLLCKSKERPGAFEGAVRCWRRVELDRPRKSNEARYFVARWVA